jgi:hypothetical protein
MLLRKFDLWRTSISGAEMMATAEVIEALRR